MLSKKYANRLETLARFLEELPASQFTYAQFEHCALGHAARIPTFRRLGLRTDPDRGHWPYMAAFGPDEPSLATTIGATLFGLTKADHFWWLFSHAAPFEKTPRFPGDVLPRYHATPQQVAAQIRAYIKEFSA